MSRFRNDTQGVLTVNDLSRRVGPGEEFDWPDHDPEVHGLIPGCTWLDAPPEEAPAETGAGDDGSGGDGGTGDGPAEDTAAEDTAAGDGEAPRTSRRRKPAGDDEGKESA